MGARRLLLAGERFEVSPDDPLFPRALSLIGRPPRMLFGVGDPHALQEGLAVVGARKATPYGRGCARKFASLAAERGIVIISGGARGCDAAAHEAAIDVGGRTVVFLGGGCDRLYPCRARTIVPARGRYGRCGGVGACVGRRPSALCVQRTEPPHRGPCAGYVDRRGGPSVRHLLDGR